MAAQVLSFFQRSPRYAPKPADWSQQELAEFYRVESALIRAGIRVGTDRGLSDENEPWFVFYRSDDGEVVIHFARIDGEYLIAGPAYEEIARGFDFSGLVRNLVARHPLIRRQDNNSNISLHPAALLVAVVGTAFFKTGEARAAETGASNGQAAHNRPVLLSSSSNAGLTNGVAPVNTPLPAYDTVQIPANQAVLVLAAALLASDYHVDTATVDPGVRAAIASAAAALDFSGVALSDPTHADTTLSFGNAPHAVAVDNTPAQTVSSALTLVALLATLPQAATVAADSVTGSYDDIRHDLSGAPASSPTDTANWALDVRLGLSSPGLPSVEAVQLVRGILGEQGYQKVTVIEVSKLPDVLAEIVERGTHYPTTPTLPEISGPTTPSPLPGEGAGTSPPPPATDDSSQPTQPSAPAQPVHPVYASPDMVKQFIDYFTAHTGQVDIVVNGSEIIILDSRVLHNINEIGHLDSMTFDFADGSSISLVGDHSSFLHDGNLI